MTAYYTQDTTESEAKKVKTYISNPPVKYKNFRSEPITNIQFLKNEIGKIQTEEINYLGVPEYQDEQDPDLRYNHIYYSSTNEPYTVFGSFFKSPGQKFLNVQFTNSHSTAIVPLGSFLRTQSKLDLFDPYALTMFNNQCCIGNINYEKLGREEPYLDMQNGQKLYSIWCEIMSRCFDPSNCLFGLYGSVGCLPFNPYWRCFRYFYKYIDTAAHYHLFDPDPNDKMMYTKPVTFYNIPQPSTMKPSLYKVLRKDV